MTKPEIESLLRGWSCDDPLPTYPDVLWVILPSGHDIVQVSQIEGTEEYVVKKHLSERLM